MNWKFLIDEYKKYLIVSNKSKETIRTQMYYINRFSKDYVTPEIVKPKDIFNFLSSPNWGGETRKSARSSIKGFYKWLTLFEYITVNPCENLPAVKVPEHLPRPTPETVLQDALRKADDRTRKMILLASFLGLRVCELCKVNVKDFDGKGLTVKGKGGKTRYIPVVHDEIREMLENSVGYLFPSVNRAHLTAHYCSKQIKKYLPNDFSAHCLRHRMATISYKNCRDILAVGKVLGHSRPETTQKYIQLCDEDLFRACASAIMKV